MLAALGLFGIASLSGQIVFTDVGSSTNTTVICNTHGSGFFDYNNDGWDNIYVVHNTSGGEYVNLDNTLLKNLRNNTFINVAREAGVAGYQIYSAQGLAAADCDNDGDLDLCIGMGMYNRALFYLNSGNGYFTERDTIPDPHNLTFHGRNLAFFDYDNDGYVDLLFLRESNNQNPNYNPMFVLYRNNRHGGFEDVTWQAGLWNFKPGDKDLYGFAVADVNNDNYPDFYVPRYDAPSMLMMNNGNGTFSEARPRTIFQGIRCVSGPCFWITTTTDTGTCSSRCTNPSGGGSSRTTARTRTIRSPKCPIRRAWTSTWAGTPTTRVSAEG